MDAILPTTEDREIGLDAEPRGAVELPWAARKPCPRGDAPPTIDHLFCLSMGRFRIPGFERHMVRLPVRKTAVAKPYRLPRKARQTTVPTVEHLTLSPRDRTGTAGPSRVQSEAFALTVEGVWMNLRKHASQ